MSKIVIIYTGGTVGGKVGQYNHIIDEDLHRKGFEHNLKKDFDFQKEGILGVTTAICKLSEQMYPDDWCRIALSVDNAVKNGATAVIVLHGTDTLSYTAAALAFMLSGIKIPVIITGSNKAYVDEKTDAKHNIRDALFVAKQDGIKGVYVVFSGNLNRNSQIHIGTRAMKRYFNDYFSYISVGDLPIGEVVNKVWTTDLKIKFTEKGKIFEKHDKLLQSKEYILRNNIVPNVSFFRVFPGFNPKLIDVEIEHGTKGIVLDLYGSGTACTEGKYSLIPSLEKARTTKIPIFATSQHFGDMRSVNYGSSRELVDRGVIFLNYMLVETAIVKLMWTFGVTSNIAEIVKTMQTNIAGEIDE